MSEKIEQMPDAFIQFCSWFHQDILHLYPSLDQAVFGFAAQSNDTDLVDLRAYLARLLASDTSDEELQRLWSDCGSEWGVSPIRPFFDRVEAMLAR